jgi:hypothetical protein
LQIKYFSSKLKSSLLQKKIKTQNWTSYTPHKLKQRISNKLRPTVENPVVQAKAEYYRQKAKETEADIMLKKEEDRRKEEEHTKKNAVVRFRNKTKRRRVKIKI